MVEKGSPWQRRMKPDLELLYGGYYSTEYCQTSPANFQHLFFTKLSGKLSNFISRYIIVNRLRINVIILLKLTNSWRENKNGAV